MQGARALPRDRGAQPRTTGRGRASSSLPPIASPRAPRNCTGLVVKRHLSASSAWVSRNVSTSLRVNLSACPMRLQGSAPSLTMRVNGRAVHPQMTGDLRDGEERLQTKLISQMTSRLRSSSCFRTGRSCLSGTVGSRRISWFTGVGRVRQDQDRRGECIEVEHPRRAHGTQDRASGRIVTVALPHNRSYLCCDRRFDCGLSF